MVCSGMCTCIMCSMCGTCMCVASKPCLFATSTMNVFKQYNRWVVALFMAEVGIVVKPNKLVPSHSLSHYLYLSTTSTMMVLLFLSSCIQYTLEQLFTIGSKFLMKQIPPTTTTTTNIIIGGSSSSSNCSFITITNNNNLDRHHTYTQAIAFAFN